MRALVGLLVIIGAVVAVSTLFMGAPGGISDARYAQFKQLAAPKVLYSCTRRPSEAALLRQARECVASGRSGCELKSYDDGQQVVETVVEFAGGTESTSYDELVRSTRRSCELERDNLTGTFKVLEAVK